MRRAGPALAALVALLVALVVVVPNAAAGGTRFRFATTVFPGGGGEPNVSISPNGKTVLVDGLGGAAQSGSEPAALWRSTDGGRTFSRLHMDVPMAGGGDFDMRWLD